MTQLSSGLLLQMAILHRVIGDDAVNAPVTQFLDPLYVVCRVGGDFKARPLSLFDAPSGEQSMLEYQQIALQSSAHHEVVDQWSFAYQAATMSRQ